MTTTSPPISAALRCRSFSLLALAIPMNSQLRARSWSIVTPTLAAVASSSADKVVAQPARSQPSSQTDAIAAGLDDELTVLTSAKRRSAGEGGPPDVAHFAVVEPPPPVHRRAVVPHDQIARLPDACIHERALLRVLGEVA